MALYLLQKSAFDHTVSIKNAGLFLMKCRHFDGGLSGKLRSAPHIRKSQDSHNHHSEQIQGDLQTPVVPLI